MNFIYYLVNDVIFGFESFYKEVEDGIYDYFGDKNIRKRCVEGIYNCVLFVKLLDVFNYDIVNYKFLNEEDNDYDYVGVGKNMYG